MNQVEQIILCILAGALAVFLIIGIVFLIKLIGLVKEAKKITVTAQSIAENADGVVENVKKITYMNSLANVAKLITERYNDAKKSKTRKEKTDE